MVVSSRAVGRRDAPGADAFASVAQGNPREAPPYEGIKLIRSRLRSCFSGHTSRSSLAKHAGYLGNVYVNEVFGFIFFMYKPFFPSPFIFLCARECADAGVLTGLAEIQTNTNEKQKRLLVVSFEFEYYIARLPH